MVWDGFLERMLEAGIFPEYKHLRNYFLFRDSCFDYEGKETKVIMDQDLKERYLKTYEDTADICLKTDYPDYKSIIEKKEMDLVLRSKRLDGIVVELTSKHDSLMLKLTAKPYFRKSDESMFAIFSVLNGNKNPETYFINAVEMSPEGLIISKESTIIPDMIGEPIVQMYQQIMMQSSEDWRMHLPKLK